MSLTFDNQTISITGVEKDKASFQKAMSFFFPRDKDSVVCYAIDPKKGMILYWYVPENLKVKSNPLVDQHSEWVAKLPVDVTSGGAPIQMLPYAMRLEAAIEFVWHWFQTSPPFGPEPDIDGDVRVGWRVYNEAWTHVDSNSSALVGIQPIWAMYGK